MVFIDFKHKQLMYNYFDSFFIIKPLSYVEESCEFLVLSF